MYKKKLKKVKKKEELPSFLLNLSSHNLERKPQKTQKSYYPNPIFFGSCNQYHSVLHPVFLGGFRRPQYSTISEESLNSRLFISERELIQPDSEPTKPAKSNNKRKRSTEFVDLHPHQCPGVRKAFAPNTNIFIPDFGQTTFEIECDTWREIPFCHTKNAFFWESSETEIKNVTLSDIKEKNRALLPYEERMAHNHFPKEFVTVKLIGPVIPASITVTKIPSKRKRISFEVEEKVIKVKGVEKTTKGGGTEEYTKLEEEAEDEKVEEMEEEDREVQQQQEKEEMEGNQEVEEGQTLEEDKSGEALENTVAEESKTEIMAEEKEEEEEAVIVNEGENIEGDKGE